MKGLMITVAALLISLGLSACSSNPLKKPFCVLFGGCAEDAPQLAINPQQKPAKTPADVVWNEEPNGLRYRIEAVPDLNRVDQGPLGLTLCVYQLKELSTFKSLAATGAGLDTLLDCKLEAAGAKSSRSFQLQPQTSRFITTDRAEEARYLAVVAGYAHLQPEHCIATTAFPIYEETEGVIMKDRVFRAVPVQMLIHLGADSVSISGVQRVR